MTTLYFKYQKRSQPQRGSRNYFMKTDTMDLRFVTS